MAPSLAGTASTAEIQRAPPPLPMDKRTRFLLWQDEPDKPGDNRCALSWRPRKTDRQIVGHDW
jgi:hypothetical protein